MLRGASIALKGKKVIVGVKEPRKWKGAYCKKAYLLLGIL